MRLGSRREEAQPATPLPPPPRNRVSPASALPNGVWDRGDKPRVRRLVERLKAAGAQMEAGLRLWLDEWVISKSDLHPSSFNLHPSHAGLRFVPLLLGDCALPDTLRRYKVVDFREESEAAFAEVLATVCLWFLRKNGNTGAATFGPN